MKKIKMQQEFIENIEFSKEWLTENIIRTDFEQKDSGQVQYIKMKKIDLLKLVLNFIKINERGE